MKKLVIKNPVISSEFLNANLSSNNLIVLDVSMASLGEKKFKIPTQGINGARFIDWKKNFVDTENSIPNMLLNEETFTIAAQNMGINKDSAIVVYDQKGIYSSPRIWWMFKAMGHQNIAILNGGFPDWVANDYPQGELKFLPFEKGNFEAKHQPDIVSTQLEVFSRMDKKSHCILDARSTGRFYGTSPEPRKELRSGHIPSSKSLPYSTLVQNGFFLPKKDLTEIFKNLTSDKTEQLIFTCGSGITASILFLAAEYIGLKNLALYDGSWSEWGAPSDYPIEK